MFDFEYRSQDIIFQFTRDFRFFFFSFQFPVRYSEKFSPIFNQKANKMVELAFKQIENDIHEIVRAGRGEGEKYST